MGVLSTGAPVEPKVLVMAGGTSNRTTLPAGSSVRLASTAAMWVQFGDVTATAVAATAPAFYLPANFEVLLQKPVVGNATSQKAATHIAAIGDGTLSIMGLG